MSGKEDYTYNAELVDHSLRIIKMYEKIEGMVAGPNKNIAQAEYKKRIDFIHKITPPQLTPQLRAAIVDQESRVASANLNYLWEDYVKPQYDAMFNTIRPKLMLLRELEKQKHTLELSQYYDQTADIKQYIAHLMKETGDEFKKYLARRQKMSWVLQSGVLGRIAL